MSEQNIGIKTISITPCADGMADVFAQIEMPGMSCSLTVQIPRQNYCLRDLQEAVLLSAIGSLEQLRRIDRG